MNFILNSIVALAIYVFINETITAKEVLLIKDHPTAPLALIKKRDKTLQLAIPVGYQTINASYDYDETADNNGNKEEFMYACTAIDPSEVKTEKHFKQIENELSEESTLFFAREYVAVGTRCKYDIKPSVKKSKEIENIGNTKYCGKYKAEIYNVGYPVFDAGEKEFKVQFMPIYKICYSSTEDKGTMYTIHHIPSPSLMMQRVWEFFTFNPSTQSFKSFLDKSDKENKSLFKNRFAYQYVGFDDMPTTIWGYATFFHFNYVPIPKNEELLTGMIAADNYIRLFSKENNKPLTLYSGSYQAMKEIPISGLSSLPYVGHKLTSINLFWRIIMDDEQNAVIMITQYTLINCYQDLICDEKQAMVKNYTKGGCTYTCAVTPAVINWLGLPQLNIKKVLALKFARKIPTHPTLDKLMDFPTPPPKNFSIYDIKDEIKFKEVLEEAKAEFQNTETGSRNFIPEKRA